jgi:glycosyltransferase involved in cell wall biosynthesis
VIFFRSILKKPDVLWCFDDGGYDNLSIFNAKLTIFHAVDHNLERQTPNCSSTADFVFATSRTILSYMKPADKSGVIINHGLRKEYISYAKKNVTSISQDKSESENLTPKNVGFWGSLLKESLDRKKILELVEHFTELNFHFIGSYEQRDSNVGGIADFENESFVSKLKALSNVKLYGAKEAAFIVQASSKFDALINLEYQFSPRWDNGNPHKILEYLAFGLPIFTTPMIAYENSTLFFITEESSDIITDFNSFLLKWRNLNSKELRLKRLNYALCNSYEQHIMEIEEFTSVA